MLKLCLIGNPNCGKSTLFNNLTNLNSPTGNWSGVTVEGKTGFLTKDSSLELIDLPGIYALRQNSDSEAKLTFDFLLNHDFDAVINVIDITALERSLYLTVQLLELGRPVAVILNKSDLINGKKAQRLAKQLQTALGCIVLTASSTESNLSEKLSPHLKKLKETSSAKYRLFDLYPKVFQEAVNQITTHPPKELAHLSLYSLLEYLMAEKNVPLEHQTKVLAQRKSIESHYNHNTELALLEARYSVVKQVLSVLNKTLILSNCDWLDKILLGRIGVLAFFAVMYVTFYCTVHIGDLLKNFISRIAQAFFISLPQEALTHLTINNHIIKTLALGIGGGLLTVAEFAPLIFILYFLLSLLEESGYLARSAFVMNKALSKVGLNGKALIPLIIGFGCNVPAITSSRIIGNMRSKIAVVLAIPFMSCSARLSVFTIIGAAFYADKAPNIIFSLYIAGIAFGLITLVLVDQLIPKTKTKDVFLLIELPQYQWPSLKNALQKSAARLKAFVFGAGKLITVVCLILHLSNSFSKEGRFIEKNHEESILVYIGKVITPIFKPIGIKEENWQASVGLIAGILAKEVVIGSIQSLYSSDLPSEKQVSFNQQFTEAFSEFFHNEQTETEIDQKTHSVAQLFDNQLAALSYMLFVLLYFPCISVFAAINKEIGYKWAIAASIWSSASAYMTSSLFYQLGSHLTQISVSTYYYSFIAFFVALSTLLAFFNQKKAVC